jgi:hypothetical protein
LGEKEKIYVYTIKKNIPPKNVLAVKSRGYQLRDVSLKDKKDTTKEKGPETEKRVTVS